MDAATPARLQRVFHLTGQRTGALAPPPAAMLPAALAGLRDLARLRHDFPVVLTDDAARALRPLSSVIDGLLTGLAPRGVAGERLRRLVLRLERALREAVAAGASDGLVALWEDEAARLAADDADLAQVLTRAGAALGIDGPLAGCDAALPQRAMRQVWERVRARRRRDLRARIDRVQRQLDDILRAAFVHSAAGRAPRALQSAMGAAHASMFDFDAMSRLLDHGAVADELPPARRARIEAVLHTLALQRFAGSADEPQHPAVFTDCASAVADWQARLPERLAVVRALAIGELEAAGAYREDEHDALFAAFDSRTLTAEELALFPDALVLIAADEAADPANAGLLELLSSGLPAKVLVQVDELLDEAAIGAGRYAFGVRPARLATLAMGLGGMFVLQAPASHLVQLDARIEAGMAAHGPALFCIYAPAPAAEAAAPFLLGAAALDSRAFPAFVYDAAAGPDWATRFALDGNRAPTDDWVEDTLEYADDALQRVTLEQAFTLADFALADGRHAQHFAVVARADWDDAQVPLAQWLQLEADAAAAHLPYVLGADRDDRLHRVLVDARLTDATRRALLLWRRLQEHAGIHDSHAERLLARERAAWEAQRALEQAAASSASAAPAAAGGTGAAAPVAAAGGAATDVAPAAPPSDVAWIETARCPSCNECQQINDRMFAYNENQQAYIKDITAGTFRQMVEAAESCQVAIIHPGKPRDPNEPGLAELIERAKPFL